MFPGVVSAGCPAADSTGAARTNYVEGTDHGSTNSVVPGTSAESLAKGWCVDECCF